MRRHRRVERLHDIDETMRFQTRKRDARKVERVNPKIAGQRCAALAFGAESFVECSVVRDDAGIAHERSELDSRIVRRRGVRNVFICYFNGFLSSLNAFSHIRGNV